MKLLQIAIGAFIYAIAKAAPFDKNCLYLSETTVGNPNINDRKISNDVQLKKIDSKMRIGKIITCTDEADEVTGV